LKYNNTIYVALLKGGGVRGNRRFPGNDGPTWEKNLIFDTEMPDDLKQEMIYSDKIHLVEI